VSLNADILKGMHCQRVVYDFEHTLLKAIERKMQQQPVELTVTCDFCEMESKIVRAGLSLKEPEAASELAALRRMRSDMVERLLVVVTPSGEDGTVREAVNLETIIRQLE
jgi:hypothetical protein